MYAATVDYRRLRRRRPDTPWKKPARQLALGAGVVVALGMGFAQVVHGSAPSTYETVTVGPGDTLWGIASDRYPGADVREKVGEIEAANGLSSPLVLTGQKLKVPSI
jgi:nucleoid-associated protein YgaU